MNTLFSFLAGLLFGIGLLVSGMANPAKVIGFLDIFRLWDPSLALVMGGAISVGFFAFRTIQKRSRPLYGTKIVLPTETRITKRLLAGAVLFGVGWGLAGICPGPGLVLLGAGSLPGLVFVLAMIAGMLIFQRLEQRRRQAVSSREGENWMR